MIMEIDCRQNRIKSANMKIQEVFENLAKKT